MAETSTDKVGRVCAYCGGLISQQRNLNAKYCSKKCKDNPERRKRWYSANGGRQWHKKYRETHKPELRLRAREWKAKNPEKVAERSRDYRKRRLNRVAAQSDGTAGRVIRSLLSLARCQYCGRKFQSDKDKRIDHRQPLVLGGEHSAMNLEVCCEPCNLRKRDMPFTQWLNLLQEPWRSRAIKRFEKARCAPLSQLSLFNGGDLSQPKKPRRMTEKQQEAKAEREAKAAWREWIHVRAPDWWLDAYYAATGKPWTDHRMTYAQKQRCRYRCDRDYKDYHIYRKASRKTRYLSLIHI